MEPREQDSKTTAPATPRKAPVRRVSRRGAPERAGRLKPADPFDLIRLLARSQHDPRKAVAELVQNSLDAGARNIVVTRYRQRGVRCLSIWDDGGGVLPEMSRDDALTYIATHIGHSRKRDLSVEERYRLLMQGKYGIGLLGFWSAGHVLEMRTKVGTESVHMLGLEEDSPRYEVHRERKELNLERTWTEVRIVDLHDAASRQLSGRRLAGYLADELRGQLLERKIDLNVIDRLARGLSRREFRVIPPRFKGVPIPDIRRVAIDGYHPARLELNYLPPETEEIGKVALTAGGTLVLDDIAALEGRDLEHTPWASGRLTGVVEFPDLDVAPGTRRGFVPNRAADALFDALRGVEARLQAVLDRFEEERRKESDEALSRQLRRIFRDITRRLPHYDLFDIHRDAPERAAGAMGNDTPGMTATPAGTDEPNDQIDESDAVPQLLPPGPLDRVDIRPSGSTLGLEQARIFRAIARDARGRRIPEGVFFRWRVLSGREFATLSDPDEPEGGGDQHVDGPWRVRLRAGDTPGAVTIAVYASEEDRHAEAVAEIEVTDSPSSDAHPELGIPTPFAVHAPGASWRSRMTEQRWEYNSAHPDYLAALSDPRRKLRYVASLFAKELVLKRSNLPGAGPVLEQVIEVMSWVERKIAKP